MIRVALHKGKPAALADNPMIERWLQPASAGGKLGGTGEAGLVPPS